MAQVKLKFLMIDRDRHGNERLYFRRRGHPKVRISEPFATDGFWEQYRALVADAEAAPRTSLPKSSPERASQKKDGFVYFLVFDRGVKIGFSTCPERRTIEVQQGAGAAAIASVIVPGSMQDERGLHSMLSRYRLRGEWYQRVWPVMQVIGHAALHIRISRKFVSDTVAAAGAWPVNQHVPGTKVPNLGGAHTQ